jgi:hypothetical protein
MLSADSLRPGHRRFLLASGCCRVWGPAAEREIGALTTLVALQASDPFPFLRLCDRASAKCLGIVRELAQPTQVVDRIFSNDFHVHESLPAHVYKGRWFDDPDLT